MSKFDKITTKAELDEYIDGGISGDAYRLFGAWACNFKPFSDEQTDEEKALRALVDSDPTEITVSPWVISQLLREKYTTVYRGIKFCFENGATLKKFCDLIENKGVKNEQ